MEVFLDSTVYVAAFYKQDIRHVHSAALISSFTRSKISTAAHSLAEVYSTLTCLPGKLRVSPEEAMLYIGDNRSSCHVIYLDDEEYWKTIRRVSEAGLASGLVYDALIAQCALKAAAKKIYTWNRRHFEMLGEDIAKRVRVPGA